MAVEITDANFEECNEVRQTVCVIFGKSVWSLQDGWTGGGRNRP